MKRFAESRITMAGVLKKSFDRFMRHNRFIKSTLKRIRNIIETSTIVQTGRELRAAVLHGPRNLKLECIPEVAVQPTQIRIDVHFCGLTDSDVLLWRNEHYRIPEPSMILGFEVSGTILEMGRLAYERTGYQMGEEVMVHNYPVCGGLAETCLADCRNVFRLMTRTSLVSAAALMDDYFSALLAIGRRARIQKNEYFLVNAKYSRTALAAIDIATGIFCAKPIAICNDIRRANLCTDFGAMVIFDTNVQCLQYQLKKITGKEKVRVIIEPEGGPNFEYIMQCLEHECLIAFLSCARDRKYPNFCLMPLNYTIFAVAAEHYKLADTLVYRETMQQLLDYQSDCIIHPRVSAIFGLDRINEAFNYCNMTPCGKVLIDMKDRNRLTFCDKF